MSIWSPTLDRTKKPLYLAIADAIDCDVRGGNLAPGTRLPPHRDLAYRLGVTPGTIGRAYVEAERRGLVVGEVGRGTYVLDKFGLPPSARRLEVPEQRLRNMIDLGLNLSAVGESEKLLHTTLNEIARQNELSSLLEYQPAGGTHDHRAAGAQWIARAGAPADAERTIVCNGGQHGLMVSLMALAGAGESVVTEVLTYPGMKALAHQFNLHLVGVPLDAEGLRPDTIEEVCRIRAPKAIYCMPSLHNPTTISMSEARRREVVRIARKHDVFIIEDDVYGFLATSPATPLAALAPERTIYISSASKSMAPGLRVGYLLVPPTLIETVTSVARMSDWMTAPLMAEIAKRWIISGSADELVRWHRNQARARQDIAHRLLRQPCQGHQAESYHFWLPLPDHWRMDAFAAEALRRGVRVTTGDVFAVRRDWPLHAVRLCLGAALREETIASALSTLSDILRQPRRPEANLV